VIRLAQHRAKPVAATLIFLYVALAVAASVCAFDASEAVASGHQHHRHHQKSAPAHSTLCTWACQINPAASLISAAPLLTPLLLAAVLAAGSSSFLFSHRALVLRSRAPPR